MIEKILSTSCLGMLLGYLSGYYLSLSSSLIKLSILILIINFVFYLFFKNSKTEKVLKSFLILTSVFILFFIIATIRGNILNKDFSYINETVKIEAKVYDIIRRDNTKIIKASIVKSNSETNQNNKNVAIYTFSQENYKPNDILEIEGKLTNQLIILPEIKMNNGVFVESGKSFDLLKYWNTHNVDFVSMYTKIKRATTSDMTIPETNTLNSQKEKLTDFIFLSSYNFRNFFSESLKKVMDTFDTGIVMAMLWGDENNISKETNNVFKSSGISHILVLSGYNLIILISAVSIIFKNFSIRKKVFLSLFFLLVFLMLAHTSAPVWRASIMSVYTLMSILFLKPANAKLGLWITCFVFFIYSPSITIFDTSFHLSFLATLGIIYFYPILEILTFDLFFKNKNNKQFAEEENKYKMRKQENLTLLKIESEKSLEDFKKYKIITSTVLVTISLNILIAPYLIYKFYYFKLSAIFLSVVVTPLVPPVMMFGFFSGVSASLSKVFILGKIFFILGKVFSFFTEIFINVIYFLAEYFSKLSPTIQSGISLKYFFIIYILIFVFYNYLKFLTKKIL